MLEKSFMKPLKGGGAREHCRIGHKLELPIAKDWMCDVNEKNVLGADLRVVSLHKVGLVSKVNCPWAKNIIDFLACVLNDGDIELWGIEINKSRQTNTTVCKEK